jgi:hypothetical protein
LIVRRILQVQEVGHSLEEALQHFNTALRVSLSVQELSHVLISHHFVLAVVQPNVRHYMSPCARFKCICDSSGNCTLAVGCIQLSVLHMRVSLHAVCVMHCNADL